MVVRCRFALSIFKSGGAQPKSINFSCFKFELTYLVPWFKDIQIKAQVRCIDSPSVT